MNSHRARTLIFFSLTEEHVKLLRQANISWNNMEYGAPVIDPKRPYGNSDVELDIACILEMPVFRDQHGQEKLTAKQAEHVGGVHRETKTALQIVLATGSFELGDYVADLYGQNWRKADPGDEG